MPFRRKSSSGGSSVPKTVRTRRWTFGLVSPAHWPGKVRGVGPGSEVGYAHSSVSSHLPHRASAGQGDVDTGAQGCWVNGHALAQWGQRVSLGTTVAPTLREPQTVTLPVSTYFYHGLLRMEQKPVCLQPGQGAEWGAAVRIVTAVLATPCHDEGSLCSRHPLHPPTPRDEGLLCSRPRLQCPPSVL